MHDDVQLFPLTNAQQRIWYTELLYPNTSVSLLLGTVKFKGNMNLDALMRSINMVIEQYDAFRIRITSENGIPLQYVVPFEYKEFTCLDAADFAGADELNAWLERHIQTPFELLENELFHFLFIKISDDEYWLSVKMHHIISDGISMVLFGNQLTEYYIEFIRGMAPSLGEKHSYIEYIEAENTYVQSDRFAKDKAFWNDKFAELPDMTGLKPYNPLLLSTAARREHFTVDRELYRQIQKFCQENRVSLFQFFMAAMYIYIHKATGEKDIAIGTSFANRSTKKEKNTVGMFVSTIAARSLVDPGIDLMSFVLNVAKEQMALLRHQKYPYNLLIQDLRSSQHHKDIQRLFGVSMEYRPVSWVDLDDVRIHTDYDFGGDEVNDLVLHIAELLDEDQLVLHVDYRIHLFDAEEIAYIIRQLMSISGYIVHNPEHSISEISLIDEQEANTILTVFNDTQADFPREHTIHRIFEEQVMLTPEQVAVILGDNSLTYRELNARANKLARMLRQQGVHADQLVGLMAERSLDMIVGILAILKAGGAYVPIDPEYPEERIHYMLEDSGAELLLLQGHLQDRVQFAGRIVFLEDVTYSNEDDTNLPSINTPADLAYVIYTSGTTGKPKGTLIEHKNVVRLLFNSHNRFAFGPTDSWTMFHSFCFDFSVWEMYGALLYGGKLVMVPSLTAKNPAQFLKLLEEQEITILNQTPTYFYQLLREALAAPQQKLRVRQVIFGGEALSPQLLKEWRAAYPNTQLINMYGITETTVHVTYKEITEVEIEQAKSNIGGPIPTLKVYVLDEHRRLLPIGVAGEMYVAGDGLARGYLNRPELTAEKFVDNPFEPGERMYRSGDLARWLPDGNIEYLGRIDHQVKIRGYRIELGEVETQLAKVEEIQEAVVLAKEDTHGEKQLCAYFVASRPLTVGELKDRLSENLPAYMLPGYFIQLSSMPLTSNGKIDRRALPAPEGHMNTGEAYIAPRNEREAQLARIWEGILGLTAVGVKDNFFEIGGHSLRATLMSARIEKELNMNLSLREVFQAPTIEQMAQLLEGRAHSTYTAIPVIETQAYYPVSSAQKRLYLLSQLEGGEISYNMPGVMLVEGDLDRKRVEKAFQQLIQRHETLRTSFDVVGGEPVQRVHAEVPFAIEYTQAKEQDAEVCINRFIRAFDLQTAPLLRVGLVELDMNRHLLLFDMHHIISDGVSIRILVDEFNRLYEGLGLPALRIQYKDYAGWQLKQAHTDRMSTQETYWLNVYQDELPVLELPTDFTRPPVQSFAGNSVEFVLDQSRTAALQQLATQTGSTLFMVLLSAYTALLHKYTRQEDIIVGTPIAGRPHADLDGIIGMFVNTLAIRSYPAADKTFVQYVQETKEASLKAFEHQDYPFEELVDKLDLRRDLSRNPLFDTLFVLQNVEQDTQELDGLQFKPYPHSHQTAKFDLTLQITEGVSELACSMEYATSLFQQDTVERLAQHLQQLIDVIIARPETKLSAIEIITPQERVQIVEQFNATAADYPRNSTIHQLFEEQAVLNGTQVALVYEGVELQYHELNSQANQLARTLREHGVVRDQPVAIAAHRSTELMVGILAILKAGGAYVAIDPDYPAERISYILEDSGAQLLLTRGHDLDRTDIDFVGQMLNLNDTEIYAQDGSNLDPVNMPTDLAYVIYTSGTTGQPKGVMIEHRNVVRLVKNTNYAVLDDNTRILQTGAITFDASTFEIWGALLNGGQLYLANKDVILDACKLQQTIEDYGITTMWLTSPLFNQLSQQNSQLFRSMKTLISGGDVLSVQHINRVLQDNPALHIVNGYGPTENTTFSTTYQIPGLLMESAPIGHPINNSTAYVVDSMMKLVPIGAWGELIVGGDGVARGYLNRPELTAEKFLQDPIRAGERCYRTGDLVRWRPDGTLEFKGRIDEQVKIRGYRIELSEIEAQLLQLEEIHEAVVIAREDDHGQKQLCAYFTADSRLNARELRSTLGNKLPSYMIPSYFVQIEQLPLTANGKVDRRMLPAPEVNVHTGNEYVAPRTAVEQALASAWQSVLGVRNISIHDSFFDLGGDSIKSIQVSSRLFQSGYRLEMKELFKNPTIAGLSPYVQAAGRVAEQGVVTGSTALLPIQHWFFEQYGASAHHFNQAVMLFREDGFQEAALRRVMTRVVEHHDALRLVFRQTDSGYQAWSRSISDGELFTLECLDLQGEANPSAAIEAKSNEIQGSMDLTNGPLLKMGLFRCTDGDHLLIVIHHLAVDGVSWRILFEDISAGYEQIMNGQEIQSPLKTDSYQAWAQELSLYADGQAMESERMYWEQYRDIQLEPLPKDEPLVTSTISDSATVTVQWSEEETELLLRQANRAYSTETNDLLLTALGLAIQSWCGIEQVMVNLEGHGREPIIPGIDITRTVGWFTTQFPVVLDMGHSELSYQIKKIKESMRTIPHKGIGFGLLKYLSEHTEKNFDHLKPDISFNYLGQFDQDLSNSSLRLSPYSTGRAVSKHTGQVYALDMNGLITGGILQLDISYRPTQYHQETMEHLAGLIHTSLQSVIQHCAGKEFPELTPSDLLLKGLGIEQLEQLSEQHRHIGEIENAYRLTPMQKGMFFHSLLEPDSSSYFEQATFEWHGPFDAQGFKQSLDALLQRHSALRTNFHNGWGDPIQIVYRTRHSEFNYEDLSNLDELQRESKIKHYIDSDRTRGFDLTQDVLLRVSVLKKDKDDYLLIWSFHHIIMDGWCVPLITREVFNVYLAAQQQQTVELAPAVSYSTYIEWLERQDHESSAQYWNDYLADYEQHTQLPQALHSSKSSSYVSKQLACSLGTELSRRIEQVAKGQQVTVNTLMQTVWGIVLQKYNNSRDVVFGSVVSGRPAEIPGIESIIGLFINTIPVRVKADATILVSELVKYQQQQYLSSHAYDTFPLYEIQAQTGQQHLINHIMVFENYPVEEQIEVLGGDQAAFEITDAELFEQTNYDFNLIVLPGEEFNVVFRFNELVYTQASIEQIQGHFVHMLKQVVNQPDLRVGELTLATPHEEAQLSLLSQNAVTAYPKEKTLQQLFEEQVQSTPDNTALVFGDEQLTYRQLNEKANGLAHTLRAYGVQANQPVGIMTERSLEMIIGLLAILKAGGAYVPIDPQYPEERIRFILEDSHATVLLAHPQVRDRAKAFNGLVLDLSAEGNDLHDTGNPTPVNGPDSLACIIYTSGSTGKPKGNLTMHYNISRVVKDTNYIRFSPQDRVLQLSSFSFDGSTFDIYGALLNGASLVLIRGEQVLDARELADVLQTEHITKCFMTTALFNTLTDIDVSCFDTLDTLLFGGEKVSVGHVRKALARLGPGRIIHVYGPTESTVFATYHAVNELDEAAQTVPIGQPISHTSAYIMDLDLHPLPAGVPGELYIGGDGLALGYLNQAELTAERFIASPFATGERLYRTGDLVQMRPDGQIEYIDRIDAQVKIRGYRIELGEIEENLRKLNSVQEAVVVVYEDRTGQKHLAAYYTAASTLLSEGTLKEELTQVLPAYMVPAYWIQLDRLPLTPNGKIDRKALPDPQVSRADGAHQEPPRTPTEAQLVTLWQDVLGLDSVGIRDNFFELGGHSLRATNLVARISREMNGQLALREIFQFPTIEQLAGLLDDRGQSVHVSIPLVEQRDYYPVSSAQKRLYVLSQLEGSELSYNMPGSLLVEGQLDRARLEEAFQQLIARHETLRTSFEIVDGEPVQRVQNEVSFMVEYEQIREEETSEHMRAFIRPFDLQQAPLLRVDLLELEPERHLLLFDMHHIVSDGASMGVLVEEFIQLYEGNSLPALQMRYKDYAVWQHSELHSERLSQQEEYWLNVFRGELPVLDLPTDGVRPALQSFKGDQIEFVIDAARSDAIRQLAASTGSTLYMVLLSAYTCLLHKYTGQEDLVVGTPIAGRPHSELEHLIGMFVGTLALRNYPSGEKTFLDYLQEVKENALRAYEHQDYPLEELVSKLNLKRDLSRNPLFDTMFALHNFEQVERGIDGLSFSTYPHEHHVAKFDLMLNVTEQDNELACSLEYATVLFRPDTAKRITSHFVQILDAVIHAPETKLAEIDMITPAEQLEIMEQFNATIADYPKDTTIHQLFEAQVARTPEKTAIIFEHTSMTYQELNERANQLARTLRAAGVQVDQRVGLMTERSLEMMVGIFAILKAGGAYVPIDPSYPEDRIRYMLEDSGAQLLLLPSHLQPPIQFAGQTLKLDEAQSYHMDGSNLQPVAGPLDMAYVIYTSGSTGKPKGVMVEHRSVINRLNWMLELYPFEPGEIIMQKTAITFDVSVWELFGWSLVGASLCLLAVDGEKDPEVILDTIATHRLSRIHFVPAMLHVFLEFVERQGIPAQSKLSSLKLVATSGEALTPSQAERFHQYISSVSQAKLVNLYGPTEATVEVSYFEVHPNITYRAIPIGRPISNIRLYVLSEGGKLQPIGVPGELCIAGVGVARGYLNRPDLTSDKFVADPFVPEGRMYRTGDLVRWQADGNIEYLGRIDHQVKIRGYRIELGEVEAQLLKVSAIQEAIVVAREEENGQKQLCAYFTADSALVVSELRGALAQELPGYMIPSYFVQLTHMPLNANGKIDRKALPAPDSSLSMGHEYVSPRTAIEEVLAAIWQSVLGMDRISIHDSFFDLGGDSIKAIQVSSRLMQAGYRLDMKHLFRYPTVSELSQHVQVLVHTADQSEVVGETLLLPIQHWYFQETSTDPHHFNHAVMLHQAEGFDLTALHKTMTRIVQHHDALRLVFGQTDDRYQAMIRGIDEGELYALDIADLRNEADCHNVIEAKASEIQRSINLNTGPLLKLGLFHCSDGDHLLIVIHHLAVDGISWRILLEDIASGYEQALTGQDIQLPHKTDSFRTWAQQLSLYAAGPAIASERAYWQNLVQTASAIAPLPKDEFQDILLRSHVDTITVQWSAEETLLLLQQANQAYNTEVSDLLLTALGMAVHAWTGSSQVLVNLEGHGREAIVPNVDITRTVGWFTSQYPVILDIGSGQGVSGKIKRVKEDLRRIPHKGIGYGILTYLSGGQGSVDHDLLLHPDISFNYLGQFDQDMDNNKLQMSSYPVGASLSEKQAQYYALDINGMISDGVLSLSVAYNRLQYHQGTMEQFSTLLQAKLSEVLLHCASQEQRELTPSDLLLSELSMEELEQLVGQTRKIGEIDNVYRLTPMQKGMLFHSQLEPESAAYFEQVTFGLEGQLDAEVFAQSLHALMRRHDILRTGFYDGLNEPVQIVYRNRPCGFLYEDLRHMHKAECDAYIEAFSSRDTRDGFDLMQDTLMRVSVFRTGEQTYRLYWSFHHIILDGWCVPLMMQEVFEHYTAIQQHREPSLTPAVPYSRYIEWLAQQHDDEASSYWLHYLEGYDQQTQLPQDAEHSMVSKDAGYVLEEWVCDLGEELTQRMEALAKEHHVTVNTLMQTAWGLVLQRYNGSRDVVFGSVVSGRPADISGIETMIGLFINTIPIRIRTNDDASCLDVLKAAQESALASSTYDTYPLYEIQAHAEQKQGLISHIMVFENYPMEQQFEQSTSASEDAFEITDVHMFEQTNYDFNLIVIPGQTLRISYRYNNLIYQKSVVERIQGHFVHILEQLTAQPNMLVSQLELVTPAEQSQLIGQLNATAAAYPKQQAIHQLFEEQVLRTPHHVAVVLEDQQLTYCELNEQANRLAHYLRAEGVQSEHIVGLLVERSLEMVIGIIAVLKAGATYVPIDPEYPDERIRYILQDSGASLLLTQSHLREEKPELATFEGKLVSLDDAQAYSDVSDNPNVSLMPHDLAYIIYTSGTTGLPKGAMITHQGLVNYIWWAKKVYVGEDSLDFPLYSSISFDLTVTSVFTPLITGNTIRIYAGEDKGLLIQQIVEDNQVDIIKLTPTHLSLIKDMTWAAAGRSRIRKLIVGGENLSTHLASSITELFGGDIQIFNEYGPTETVVGCMIYRYDPVRDTRESVPIGVPADNVSIYLLDAQGHPVPIGVPGEMYIAGDGVARGYLNRPELTAEKFMDNPFVPGGRMYRTGDLARRLADGHI
uniref:non-ribosomal peptide synthetase n=1 Tax=Paenibacillus massiliensis TaxID=225917 RepID=UPI00046FE480